MPRKGYKPTPETIAKIQASRKATMAARKEAGMDTATRYAKGLPRVTNISLNEGEPMRKLRERRRAAAIRNTAKKRAVAKMVATKARKRAERENANLPVVELTNGHGEVEEFAIYVAKAWEIWRKPQR